MIPVPRDPRPSPACADPACDRPAAFRLYRPDAGRWRPICERHARHLHPSLELHAWLESGYLKPVEVAAPDGPPPAPSGERGAAFRDLVAEAMGWSR